MGGEDPRSWRCAEAALTMQNRASGRAANDRKEPMGKEPKNIADERQQRRIVLISILGGRFVECPRANAAVPFRKVIHTRD